MSRRNGLGVLRALTVVMGAVTGACLANPKACFRARAPPSIWTRPGRGRPEAEGFSESIARVLEARDVDALFTAKPQGRSFALTMRNEALETHAVRRVRLLVAERPLGGRVLAGADRRYYPATSIASAEQCRAPEGDCRAAVAALDGSERRSLADAGDLATREDVDLIFSPAKGRVGLVLEARQTLLTTFLSIRRWPTLAARRRLSGGVGTRREGQCREGDGDGAARWAASTSRWPMALGRGFESGASTRLDPSRAMSLVLPFESNGREPIRVRLRQAKGHWRLGWVALAHLGDPVVPQVIEAASVTREGRPDAGALARLRGAEDIW